MKNKHGHIKPWIEQEQASPTGEASEFFLGLDGWIEVESVGIDSFIVELKIGDQVIVGPELMDGDAALRLADSAMFC